MDDFHKLADHIIEEVADFFESSWPKADVDLLNETLMVSLPQGEFVINKHGVTSQIWVASPFTGAHHFSYREGIWVCTRTGRELFDFFQQERNSNVS